jgi:hypothetical protein
LPCIQSLTEIEDFKKVSTKRLPLYRWDLVSIAIYKASIMSVGPQYMNLMAVTRVKSQRPALYADDVMPIEMQTIKNEKA